MDSFGKELVKGIDYEITNEKYAKDVGTYILEIVNKKNRRDFRHVKYAILPILNKIKTSTL